MDRIAAYAKLLRLPGIGALGIPTVIAALTVGVVNPVDLTIVFLIGAIACVFGFVLNDYTDVELDKLVKDLHRKPLVSGIITKKAALLLSMFLMLLSFLLIIVLWYGESIDQYKVMAMVCIFTAGILGFIYDIYGKKIIGSDFLIALSVALIFLFGALSFGRPTVITWIIFILTFNNLLYMNAVQNGIKDADHDYKMNVTNIARSAGVKVNEKELIIPSGFKAFGMGIRLCSAVLLITPFVFFEYPYHPWQMLLLLVGILIVLFISTKLLTMREFDRNKIRTIIGVQSFLRYSLVPVMLMSIIGVIPSLILIVFPMVWYIGFTPLLGEKMFKPRM